MKKLTPFDMLLKYTRKHAYPPNTSLSRWQKIKRLKICYFPFEIELQNTKKQINFIITIRPKLYSNQGILQEIFLLLEVNNQRRGFAQMQIQ